MLLLLDGVAAGSATGTLGANEAGTDSAALSGAVRIGATLLASEMGADGASLAVQLLASGVLAAAESEADALGCLGTVSVAFALSGLEDGADGFAATGVAQSSIAGVLRAAEYGDDLACLKGLTRQRFIRKGVARAIRRRRWH